MLWMDHDQSTNMIVRLGLKILGWIQRHFVHGVSTKRGFKEMHMYITMCLEWMRVEWTCWATTLTSRGSTSVQVGTMKLNGIAPRTWYPSHETVHGVILFGLWTFQIDEFGNWAFVNWSLCLTCVQYWSRTPGLWENTMWTIFLAAGISVWTTSCQ